MYGLSETVLNLLKNYFSNHPQVLTVFIYGSRAMEREKKGSDIDLAIITQSDEDISARVQADLEKLSTPYIFDVVDYQRITYQPLRDHIDRVGKILFQRK